MSYSDYYTISTGYGSCADKENFHIFHGVNESPSIPSPQYDLSPDIVHHSLHSHSVPTHHYIEENEDDAYNPSYAYNPPEFFGGAFSIASAVRSPGCKCTSCTCNACACDSKDVSKCRTTCKTKREGKYPFVS